mgnify:CR=1 FL=1
MDYDLQVGDSDWFTVELGDSHLQTMIYRWNKNYAEILYFRERGTLQKGTQKGSLQKVEKVEKGTGS